MSLARLAIVGVLGIHRADIDLLRLLRLMGMFGAGIDAQVRELPAPQRAARQHAFNGFVQHAFGKLAAHDSASGAFLDAADIASVMVVHLLLELVPSQYDLRR